MVDANVLIKLESTPQPAEIFRSVPTCTMLSTSQPAQAKAL